MARENLLYRTRAKGKQSDKTIRDLEKVGFRLVYTEVDEHPKLIRDEALADFLEKLRRKKQCVAENMEFNGHSYRMTVLNMSPGSLQEAKAMPNPVGKFLQQVLPQKTNNGDIRAYFVSTVYKY